MRLCKLQTQKVSADRISCSSPVEWRSCSGRHACFGLGMPDLDTGAVADDFFSEMIVYYVALSLVQIFQG